MGAEGEGKDLLSFEGIGDGGKIGTWTVNISKVVLVNLGQKYMDLSTLSVHLLAKKLVVRTS